MGDQQYFCPRCGKLKSNEYYFKGVPNRPAGIFAGHPGNNPHSPLIGIPIYVNRTRFAWFCNKCGEEVVVFDPDEVREREAKEEAMRKEEEARQREKERRREQKRRDAAFRADIAAIRERKQWEAKEKARQEAGKSPSFLLVCGYCRWRILQWTWRPHSTQCPNCHSDLPVSSKFVENVVTFATNGSLLYDLRFSMFRKYPPPPDSLPNHICPLCKGQIIYEKTNIGKVGECPHCKERIWYC